MKKEKTKKTSAKAAEDQTVPGTAEDINNEAEATAIAPTSVATEGVETPNASESLSEDQITDNHLAGQTVVMVKPDDLTPNTESTKVYGDEVCPALEASIADEGIQNPLVVDRSSKTVIDGNSRLRVAIKLAKDAERENKPIQLIPVIFVDGGNDPLAMVASNVAREKSLEVKVREFVVYVDQEKKEAKLRRKMKLSVPPVEPSKSRDRAAAKVGLSATHLEEGREIVNCIDNLLVEGDERADRLREALNKRSVKRAQELAVEYGLITAKTEATTIPKKKKVNEPELPDAEGEIEGRVSVTESGPDTTATSSAATHIAALKALAAWCGEDEALELDEEKKTALGDAFAAADKAMTDAGIISVGSLN
jgi:hypothetical protein